MQIKFLATGRAFDYTINGETVNGFDLSVIEHGGKFIGSEETREAGIRNAERDEAGELWVTLCQAPPVTKIIRGVEMREGDWRESDWIDAANYDPETLYIVDVTPGGASAPLGE